MKMETTALQKAAETIFRQSLADYRLHCFGLRNLFRRQAGTIQHVQEIGVAAGVQLIRALDFDAAFAEKIDNRAVQNSRAHLRFDIVTN